MSIAGCLSPHSINDPRDSVIGAVAQVLVVVLNSGSSSSDSRTHRYSVAHSFFSRVLYRSTTPLSISPIHSPTGKELLEF